MILVWHRHCGWWAKKVWKKAVNWYVTCPNTLTHTHTHTHTHTLQYKQSPGTTKAVGGAKIQKRSWKNKSVQHKMLQWGDVFWALGGSQSEAVMMALSASWSHTHARTHTHTHTHTHACTHTEITGFQQPAVCQGYEIICVHAPFNTILLCFFASIQAETRLGKDKNRTSLTSSFSLPLSLSLPSLLSHPFSLCLQSDIDAAVLLQLGNAHAPAQAEGWLGSRLRGFSLSPVGNVAFINTIHSHNKLNIQKHRIKWNNRQSTSVIHQQKVVQEFVWCNFVANLWSRV